MLYPMTPYQESYKKSPIPWIRDHLVQSDVGGCTIDRMTTHGRFILETIARDSVDFPEPELPAIAMMLTSAHGGE